MSERLSTAIAARSRLSHNRTLPVKRGCSVNLACPSRCNRQLLVAATVTNITISIWHASNAVNVYALEILAKVPEVAVVTQDISLSNEWESQRTSFCTEFDNGSCGCCHFCWACHVCKALEAVSTFQKATNLFRNMVCCFFQEKPIELCPRQGRAQSRAQDQLQVQMGPHLG